MKPTDPSLHFHPDVHHTQPTNTGMENMQRPDLARSQDAAYDVPIGVDTEAVAAATRQLLHAIGENPDREGLRETPARVARWWREFIDYEPGKLHTSFGQVEADQLVIVSGMRVWSLCEHHLLPFWCDVTVAYLVSGKMLGLSKLARMAHKHAHQLQVQERLVNGLAEEVAEAVGHENVAVVASGVHLCMVMRGIKTHGMMQSSALRGKFKAQPELRAEFMALHTKAVEGK